ncbi:hypothetical protein P152DRAFT_455011 [Eremomyces bilateralis CBS 781.70]|uniref:Cupin type-2 domain-containing protein n=1 Tax=Eremomyces bilateralis CBS 781.70 TaxID=1392243 RepID=A0A6G1GBL1_9PEZI|nr:uncharacterized protein P152DRAFT_455011 [Eremomyces bilateralis CBS 781.70]KAF1815290.1 hypothetical protein P152DRAFT_455011 [Eremomyces bilateralis CBS 781.70]
MAHVGELPPISRHITAQDPQSGKAVFLSTPPSDLKFAPLPVGRVAATLGYATSGFPVDLNNGADLKAYEGHLETPPGLTISNGSVLRIVDFAPASNGPMHITESIDYGVVLEGQMEAALDSGETRLLKRGDIVVQRGTNHAWNNPSSTEWARMLFVLIAAVTPITEKKVLEGESSEA